MNFQNLVALGEAASIVRTGDRFAKIRALSVLRATSWGTSLWWEVSHVRRDEAEVFIFGGIYDSSLLEKLQSLGDRRLILRFDCSGGDANVAVPVGSFLAERENPSLGIVTANCSSAANFVLAGCTRRTARPDAKFMTHGVRQSVTGMAPELRRAADELDVTTGEIVSWFAAQIRRPLPEVQTLWAGEEKYFDADEAKAAGLIDDVIEPLGEEPATPKATRIFQDDEGLATELAKALATLSVADKKTVYETLLPWFKTEPQEAA